MSLDFRWKDGAVCPAGSEGNRMDAYLLVYCSFDVELFECMNALILFFNKTNLQRQYYSG